MYHPFSSATTVYLVVVVVVFALIEWVLGVGTRSRYFQFSVVDI